MTLFYRRPRFTNPPLDTPFELNQASLQARGLVAWWPPIASRGANMLRDMVGGRGAIFKGAGEPIWAPDTMLGLALDFDGSNDYINCGTDPAFAVSAIALSIVIWIYTSQADFNNTVKIFADTSTGNPFTNDGFWLGTDDRGDPLNGISFNPATVTGGNRSVYSADDVIAVNPAWYYVVATYSASSGRLFINGRDRTAADYVGSGNYTPRNANLYLGGANDGTYAFPGMLADTRIHNVALSPAEIWQMWDPASRWDLYLPTVRWWALGAPAGAVRILPQLAMLGGQSVPSISPHVGGLL